MKTFLLDTNVLLSDPNSLFSFENNNIVMPLIVLEELDRHKDRQDETGRNARETIRKLTDLTKKVKDLRSGIKLGDHLGTLKVVSSKNLYHIDLPKELDPTGDNKIIDFYLSYKETFKDEKLILVTRDLQLQIKSSALDVVWEDYKKLSSSASSSNTLYSGVATIHLTSDRIEEFFDTSSPFVLLESEVEESLYPNQFVVLTNEKEAWGNVKSGVARFCGWDKPLRQLQKDRSGKLTTKNKEQDFATDLLFDTDVQLVTISGKSGCGKTLVALNAGLEQVIGKSKKYKNLVVCRPMQPVGKDVGFLPGELADKLSPWISPIKDNLRFLLSDGKKGKVSEDIMQSYFDQGIIEVEALTFIRGRSIANAFILIDECQNLNLSEVKVLLTRAGEGTKIVITGDIEQIDNLHVDSVTNGLSVVIEKFKNYDIAGHVTFSKGVRSALATLSSEIL